jgi:hypothetical protein
MSRLKFRTLESTPTRTYVGKELSNYRGYKDNLRDDFKCKCGYTNCIDNWFGGPNTFQIDHFLPQSKYPKLKTKYSNLIYCCSYVNRAKSNDEGKYLDPCNVDYNLHFYRNSKGEIIPETKSDDANYMYKKLKLYLKRYSIIWSLEQLEKKMDELELLLDRKEDDEIKDLFIEVTRKYMKYKRYLRANQ